MTITHLYLTKENLMTQAVFSDIEGTLIRISFPRTYFEQALALGVVPRSNQRWMAFYGLLGKPFSSKSKIGGMLRYLAIMTAMKNVPATAHAPIMERMIPLLHAALKPNTIACIREYEAKGMPVILVSAAGQQGVSDFAKSLGWRGEGTRLIIENGVFTGRAEVALSGEEKAVRVRAVAQEMGIDLAQSIGFGDTVTDVPFLSLLGTVYVVDPAPDLRAIAQSKGWQVIEN